jgi:hypothetical protein
MGCIGQACSRGMAPRRRGVGSPCDTARLLGGCSWTGERPGAAVGSALPPRAALCWGEGEPAAPPPSPRLTSVSPHRGPASRRRAGGLTTVAGAADGSAAKGGAGKQPPARVAWQPAGAAEWEVWRCGRAGGRAPRRPGTPGCRPDGKRCVLRGAGDGRGRPQGLSAGCACWAGGMRWREDHADCAAAPRPPAAAQRCGGRTVWRQLPGRQACRGWQRPTAGGARPVMAAGCAWGAHAGRADGAGLVQRGVWHGTGLHGSTGDTPAASRAPSLLGCGHPQVQGDDGRAGRVASVGRLRAVAGRCHRAHSVAEGARSCVWTCAGSAAAWGMVAGWPKTTQGVQNKNAPNQD